jgi:hypothetical protein
MQFSHTKNTEQIEIYLSRSMTCAVPLTPRHCPSTDTEVLPTTHPTYHRHGQLSEHVASGCHSRLQRRPRGSSFSLFQILCHAGTKGVAIVLWHPEARLEYIWNFVSAWFGRVLTCGILLLAFAWFNLLGNRAEESVATPGFGFARLILMASLPTVPSY